MTCSSDPLVVLSFQRQLFTGGGTGGAFRRPQSRQAVPPRWICRHQGRAHSRSRDQTEEQMRGTGGRHPQER